MASLLFFVLSMVTAVVGTHWGVYVGRRHRGWNLSEEVGLAIAVAPPFLISIACGIASVLCK